MFRPFNLMLVTLLGSLVASHVLAATLTDPTRPDYPTTSKAQRAQKPKPLRLQSTLVSPQRTVAVINGTTLAIGDAIRGYRVTAIEAGQVQLAKAGHTTTLTLTRRVVKTDTRNEANQQ